MRHATDVKLTRKLMRSQNQKGPMLFSKGVPGVTGPFCLDARDGNLGHIERTASASGQIALLRCGVRGLAGPQCRRGPAHSRLDNLRAPRTMTILSLDLPPLWRDARFHC